MFRTCIDLEIYKLVVRPVWDIASRSIDESQCKTCLGYDIDLDI
ncbi:hypothetical protein F383_07632 [Gossypium arboreum]|uniref:Uncharacterized protein n=1 Tax=Gossypium arboreum TaxID=29729 RepID=A0A0B0NVP5_GOSAR|nr:hypothetical protein F383_07632 [Gossypium arboreum]